MKNSHKKILLFNILICILLFVNSTVFNFLNGYFMALFLLSLLFIFKLIFGYEKDKYRYLKDIIIEVIIFIIMFFILYYIFGILIGFAKTGNYYNFYGITTYILPIILNTIFIELFRYMIMIKSQGSKIAIISSVIMLIFINITNLIAIQSFSSSYSIFLFFALTVLPSISSNIVFSIMTLSTGYKPIIIYSLIMNLYPYILPIIPNPNEFIASIIYFVLPILIGLRIYLFFQKEQQYNNEIKRQEHKHKLSLLIFPTLITLIIVYFTSGSFNFWAIAIASGSMSPKINKGDVVIIEKVDNNYSDLKENDVIAYKHNNIVVVHRLINIVKDNDKYYFYTKGDANNDPDNLIITEQMIIGKVNIKIPYIGIPSVWINDI